MRRVSGGAKARGCHCSQWYCASRRHRQFLSTAHLSGGADVFCPALPGGSRRSIEYPRDGGGWDRRRFLLWTAGCPGLSSDERGGRCFVEMESDTLFIVGAVRNWRTAAIFASDGAPGQIKPEWGEADFRRGELDAINIALHAMWKIAQADQAK